MVESWENIINHRDFVHKNLKFDKLLELITIIIGNYL